MKENSVTTLISSTSVHTTGSLSHTGEHPIRGWDLPLSSVIASRPCKQSRIPGTSRDNRSSMPFYKQPETLRPRAYQFDYSGYPDFAKCPGTTLPICWLRRQPYRGRPTRSTFCYHAREHTLGKGSTPNGRKNGTTRAPTRIYVRSTTHCRLSTLNDSTAPCLEIEGAY